MPPAVLRLRGPLVLLLAAPAAGAQIPGTPEAGDDLGSAVAAGDFNVLYSSTGGGLTADHNQFWYQSGRGTGRRGSTAAVADTPLATAPLTAFPNPFYERTTLRLALAATGRVRLAVYDLLGREVAVLADGTMEAGSRAVAFDAGTLPAGTYLVRLEAAEQVLTRRLTRRR